MKPGRHRDGLRAPMSRRLLPLGVCAVLLAACGGDDTTQTVTTATVAPANTVGGVGRLPSTIPEVTFAADVAEGIVLPALEGVAIGEEVAGNRVLMIGDSIFAGLSPRHSDTACDQLEPLGWQVAVEAESGRFAEFGARVAQRRAGEGWDVVVVFLGSNYDGAQERYERDMRRIVERFSEVPMVLVTTTLFRSMQSEVNEVVRTLAAERETTRLVEWETISRSRGLLSGDGLHPSADGQLVLTAAVAQVLGQAPSGEGACLPSFYTDDSVNPDGPRSGGTTTSGRTPSGGSATGSATNTSTSVATGDDAGESVETSLPDDSTPDGSTPTDSTMPTDSTTPNSTMPTDSTTPTDTAAPGTTAVPSPVITSAP